MFSKNKYGFDETNERSIDEALLCTGHRNNQILHSRSQAEMMCRYKLEEFMRDNEQLKLQILNLKQQNSRIKALNMELEADLHEILANFLNIEQSQLQQQLKLKGIKNESKYRALVYRLQSENKLLIQFKDICQRTIRNLNGRIRTLQSDLQQEKEQSLRLNQKNSKQIQRLESIVKEATQEFNLLNREKQQKDAEREENHRKFHRELEKMKEKAEKYKSKAHSYRSQRDELALQIQKVKQQIGAVTFKKYFPDDDSDA